MKVHSMISTSMNYYQTSSCFRYILKRCSPKRYVKMASKFIETCAEALHGLCPPAYNRQYKTWRAVSARFSRKTFEPQASYTHTHLAAAAPVLLPYRRVIRRTGLALGAGAVDIIRLSVNSGLSGKLKTRVNGREIDADLTGSISASYSGEESADSNSWDVTVPDAKTRSRNCARAAHRASGHYLFSSCSRNILLGCRSKELASSVIPVSQIAQKPELALTLEQE